LRGYRKATCVSACALFSISLIALDGCGRKKPARARNVDWSILELVSLAQAPDDTHTIRVADRDGKAWYRERQARADLRHFDLSVASVTRIPDKDFCVVLVVNDPDWDIVRSWSEDHLGKYAGFVFERRVMGAARVEQPVTGHLVLPGFKTQKDAADALLRLRAASAGYPMATQPS
jgi:hypothetical protein